MSSITLNEAQLIALVESYFAAVDRKDVAGALHPLRVLALPTTGCFTTAETPK